MSSTIQPSTDELLQLLHRHWGYTRLQAQAGDDHTRSSGRSRRRGCDADRRRQIALLSVAGVGPAADLCRDKPAYRVDAGARLRSARIPAAYLNSTLNWQQQQAVRKDAEQGAFRLLYISPERLVREDTAAWLRNVPIGFFAVDEAHCISEWGHEFRPEYRQLRMLRDLFPDKPIAAFTPPGRCGTTSWRNSVRECRFDEQNRLLLDGLRAYQGSNVIVYAPTIATVEDTVATLQARGFKACKYHGRMEAAERKATQEAWMRGETPILVGTLAFGLGINKPDVRAVIHLALPKSLEQYYQEAGRAGRDGLPADCTLLWQKRDTALLAHFINEIVDSAEKQRAWQRYRSIVSYTGMKQCRQRHICLHFGETPKWESCGKCDTCGTIPEWLTSSPPRASSPVSSGRKRSPSPLKPSGGTAVVDAVLQTRLKTWRSETASKLGWPEYVLLHDTTVDEICRRKPQTISELLDIPGLGPKKIQSYGRAILSVVTAREK